MSGQDQNRLIWNGGEHLRNGLEPAQDGHVDVQDRDVRADLRSNYSNPQKPLGTLISRALHGWRAHRPCRLGARITDERGPVRENARQSQIRLSVSNRAELLAAYAAGVPVQELAARFGVHQGTVWEAARRAELEA